MDSQYGRKSSAQKRRLTGGRSGSLAPFSPLSPVAEDAELFKFDDVSVDLQLDRALNAIVADDVNSLLSTLANGLEVSSLYNIVSHGAVLPPPAPPAGHNARFSTSRFSLASNATSRDTLIEQSETTSASYASLSRAVRGDDLLPSLYLLGPVVRASLLHVACAHRALRCAKFIAHLGASLDAPESYRQDTALHIAARLGDDALIEIICGAGADLQAKNMLQDSALHLAASGGHIDVVRYLLATGANHLAKNRFGDTPWDGAKKSGTARAKICADLLYTHHCQLKADSQA